MINLLPDDTKRQIRAARANSSLVKIIIFLGFSFIFLVLACVASYMFLDNSKTDAEKVITTNQSKSNSYSSVSSQAKAIESKLSTAKSILNQQILYSNIITGIATVLPNGVVLDDLSLSNDTLGTPMVLKLRARTYDQVVNLKNNFQKSLLFSGYSLQSLQSDPNDTTGYPVQITVGVTINKSASL
jgi:Tfp pilus assembly protein PilN